MEEVWKDIDGLPYKVSNMGRVASFVYHKDGKLLKPRRNRDGYLSVVLFRGDGSNVRTTMAIARMVAKAFCDNPDNKPEVNHKDGNKQNNSADNLEWCTRGENVKHAFDAGLQQPTYHFTPEQNREFARKKRKLTDEQVRSIRRDTRTLKQIAGDYGMSFSKISDVKRGNTYRDVSP